MCSPMYALLAIVGGLSIVAVVVYILLDCLKEYVTKHCGLMDVDGLSHIDLKIRLTDLESEISSLKQKKAGK